MLTRIEALGFRALRYISQPLDRFHVLVGPNASGKTTFLDVPALLGRLVSDGLEAALFERTYNFADLTWRREGRGFELAVEALIPLELRPRSAGFDTIRYEVQLGLFGQDEFSIRNERVSLTAGSPTSHHQPLQPELPPTLWTSLPPLSQRPVVGRIAEGLSFFCDEEKDWRGEAHSLFTLNPGKSALGSLPEDETQFPAATWFKRMLTTGVQQLILNSLLLRKASPPGQARRFKPDGSNLPWVVADLRDKAPERFQEWLAHLRTALPDLEDIRTVIRADDRHRYLMLRHAGGMEVPSWMVSDGTLRLLALTLPAYLPDFHGIYLIEEPENGIHPRAIETVLQSLSSVYDAQILLATHSPVILSVVDVKDVLCFSRTPEGATGILRGDEHPALQDWKGESSLGTLFAAGVLG